MARQPNSSSAMSKPMNWDLCIVCQKNSSEKLRCPAHCASDQAPADVYSAFLQNVENFRELNALPVDVNFGEHGTVQAFVQHSASWHKQCHQKFNNSMLERARQRLMRKRKSVEGEVTLRSKRKLNLTSTHCIFCDETTSESLHEFTTLNVDQVIRDMASEMGDSDLLVKLSGGIDIVAIEGKYHISCLTKYRNRYRSFLRTQCAPSQSNVCMKKARARVFAELVMDIESALEEGIYVFKLIELHTAYESRLKTLNFDSSINRTRLKKELLDYFKGHGIQEQSDGKQVIFVFPEGMHSLLKNVSIPSQMTSEALQLARVAKLVRAEIFQAEKTFEFANKFPPNCQTDCVPYSLNLLISMILYGPNLKNVNKHNDSQSCLTISQLIIVSLGTQLLKVSTFIHWLEARS